jgi:hypothetical protein
VNDEKFAEIYAADEKMAQLQDDGRTIMTFEFGSCVCALGIRSYSSGIHRIRIRIDRGSPVFGIHSRNIAPIPDKYNTGYYGGSPSTYGWEKNCSRVLNGEKDWHSVGTVRSQYWDDLRKRKWDNFKNQNFDKIHDDSLICTITINCDEHRLSIINETTKEQDEMEVDVCHAPLPWCLFIATPRMPTWVSLI